MANLQIVLDFLSALEANNNREWMEKNKAWYKQARAEFEKVAEELLPRLTTMDERLAGVAVKDCIFRINRDIRFSNDKRPYKNNFGVHFNKGGKNGASAGYYLHIQPGDNSMIGGGRYMPTPDELKAIRQEIDYNADKFLEIINEPGFKKHYGKVQGEKLVKAPKGYAPDNPVIEWLKLKNFYVMHPLKDNDLLADNFVENIVEILKAMKPFNDFVNEALSSLSVKEG